MDIKNEINSKVKIILAKNYLKIGEYTKSIQLLGEVEKGCIEEEEKLNLLENILQLIEKEKRISIILKENQDISQLWGENRSALITRITPYFPGSAYTLLMVIKKEEQISENNYKSLLKQIIYSLEKRLIRATDEGDKFPVREIENLSSDKENKDLHLLLARVANAYIGIGFIDDGIRIYKNMQREIPNNLIKRTAENSESLYTKATCYLYLNDVGGLKDILPHLMANELSEKLIWRVAKRIVKLNQKKKKSKNE